MSDTEEDSTSSDSWPVNEDWLNIVLKQNYGNDSVIKIKDFSVKSGCHSGVSNLSDIISVTVSFELNNNNSLDTSSAAESAAELPPDTTPPTTESLDLVIKLLPHDPFSRYFVTEAQFDLREIKFYTKILPDLMKFQNNNLRPGCEPMAICVPKCFHTHYTEGRLGLDGHTSPEPPESILVLQDMRSKQYKAAHFTKGLTLHEAENAVRAIASVHALSLGMKFIDKIDLNEKYPFLFQISKATESYQQLVEQGLPQLSRFLERKTGRDRELNALSDLRPKTKLLIENLLQPVEPMGLITHTDFWSNNLLFKENFNHNNNNDNCIILDWQMITYSRATNDIALLIISSLPSNVRRENTSKILDIYYETMKINCNKLSIDLEVDLGYNRDKLEAEYKQSQLLALLLCVGSVDVAIGNHEAEERLLDVLHDLYDEGILCADD